MKFCFGFCVALTLVGAAPISISSAHAQEVTTVASPDKASKILKRKIAVGRFANETRYGQTLLRDANLDPLGKQAVDILAAHLVQTGKFLVFERTDTSQIDTEQRRIGAKNELVQPASIGLAQQAPNVQTVNSRATPVAITELSKLEHPWAIEMLPDGSSLITEKRGTLRNWRDNKLSAPLSGVPSVAFRGQGGLLDIALDPQFAENRIIYLSYAEAATSQPGGQDVADDRLGIFQELDDAVAKGLAVARAELSDDGLRNVRVIWRAEKTIGRGHFGGRMAFDRSGALLITSGDRQRFEPAQDVSSDLGKIIRIRSTDGASLPDNPFANAPNSQRDVWSFGHRNPLGIAVRPGSDEIWVAEMGPQNGDELNLLRRGGNFGWPLVSAGDNYNQTTLPRPSTRPDLIGAHAAFPIAVSPASLIFYQGTLFGPWRGDVLVGTLNRPGILRGKVAPDGVHDLEHLETGFRVRDLAQAPDGSILVLRDGADGGLFRLTPSKP